MRKDCENCEYFGGWDEDGYPDCIFEGDIKDCPYKAACGAREEKMPDGAMKIEVDTEPLNLYVQETLKNTVRNITLQIVEREISKIITATYEAEIQSLTQDAVSRAVDTQVAEFMAGGITVGGGWREPQRTLSRTEYMSELIEKELSKRFNSDSMKETAQREAKSAIDRFSVKLKDEINAGVKQYFDAATRQVLTENIVSMLMSNDTYRRLSDSMTTFLPGKTT